MLYNDAEAACPVCTWTGKLLITSRHPFVLAGQAGATRLVFRHLGPLTRSGAAELATALPAIGLLGEAALTETGLPRTEPTELPEAAAELIASAAGQLMFGELFGRLSAGARSTRAC